MGLLHIRLDLGDALQLIRRLLVGKIVLKVALPRGVGREGEARRRLARRIEPDQLIGHLHDLVLNAGFGALPLRAAQAVELGLFILHADVLLHAVELIRGDVERVRTLILDVQIVARLALHGHAHGAGVHADAVALMHHVVAHLQICKGLNFLPRLMAAPSGALARGAEKILVAQHRKARLGQLKAAGQTDGQHGHLPRAKGCRLFLKGDGQTALAQRLGQALAACASAREHGHGQALAAVELQLLDQQRVLPLQVGRLPGFNGA